MPSLFCNRWTYERLPSNSDRASCAKYNGSSLKWWACVMVMLVVASVFWVTSRKYYSPLDHYQNLNPLPITTSDWGPSPPSRRAVLSSLYSDSFAIAVAVTGYSAKSANVSARLLLPYLEKKVSERALCIVRAVGWEPYPVPLIPPPHGGKDIHARFIDQYTKLNIWRVDEMGIDSAVYLDADTLVLRNFDELFDSPFNFAAVPDVYRDEVWETRGFSIGFNAGVLVFRPSSSVFDDMLRKMEVADYPLREAEQAFLNLYFGGTCMRLPYIYNANLAMKARSPTLWQRLTDEMRIVHYTIAKPFVTALSQSSTTILTEEEIEKAIDREARKKSGLFRDEVEWWATAYKSMMLEHGHTFSECR